MPAKWSQRSDSGESHWVESDTTHFRNERNAPFRLIEVWLHTGLNRIDYKRGWAVRTCVYEYELGQFSEYSNRKRVLLTIMYLNQMTLFWIRQAHHAHGGRKITAGLIENPNKTSQRNPGSRLRSNLAEQPAIQYKNEGALTMDVRTALYHA